MKFNKVSLSVISRLLSATAIAIVATGCAISPEKIGRIDSKPIAAGEQSAMLAWGSSKSFPNQIVTRWIYSIKEINGKPFPKGKAFVQLEPGEYTIKIACGARFAANDLGWFDGESTTSVSVVAGKTYWAWIEAEQTAVKQKNGSIFTTAGRCWATGFNGNNPYLVVSN